MMILNPPASGYRAPSFQKPSVPISADDGRSSHGAEWLFPAASFATLLRYAPTATGDRPAPTVLAFNALGIFGRAGATAPEPLQGTALADPIAELLPDRSGRPDPWAPAAQTDPTNGVADYVSIRPGNAVSAIAPQMPDSRAVSATMPRSPPVDAASSPTAAPPPADTGVERSPLHGAGLAIVEHEAATATVSVVPNGEIAGQALDDVGEPSMSRAANRPAFPTTVRPDPSKPNPVRLVVCDEGVLRIVAYSGESDPEVRASIRDAIDQVAAEYGVTADDVRLDGVPVARRSFLQGVRDGYRAG